MPSRLCSWTQLGDTATLTVGYYSRGLGCAELMFKDLYPVCPFVFTFTQEKTLWLQWMPVISQCNHINLNLVRINGVVHLLTFIFYFESINLGLL